MDSWASTEFSGAALGDHRRTTRLIALADQLSLYPSSSIPTACATAASWKGAYRFMSNDAVDPAAIIEAHIRATVARIGDRRRVLCIQDTTELDYTGHEGTAGLGYLSWKERIGMFLHSGFAVSEDGEPLGLIGHHTWTRALTEYGKGKTTRSRPLEERESWRWVEMAAETERRIPATVEMITIADREADIFALFARERRAGSELLIRASRNRRITHEIPHLQDAIAQQPCIGTHTVEIRRAGNHAARQATLQIRIGAFTIPPPPSPDHARYSDGVPVHVILAEEEGAPASTRIRWMLMTTMRIETFDEAVRCIQWYARRWLIERFHFTLKSGCRVEELQLETADRLRRAIALYSVIAWRLLWMTHQARVQPEAPCEAALEPVEWQALCCLATRTPVPPTIPPTMHEAVRMLAMLGGFLGRTRDGSPGVKTLWRGMQRLEGAALMYELMRNEIHAPPQP